MATTYADIYRPKTAVIFFLVLFVVQSNWLPTVGQWSCPLLTVPPVCACANDSDTGSYVIVCGGQQTGSDSTLPLSAMPTTTSSSSSSTTVFRSLSFDASVSVAGIQASPFVGLRVVSLRLYGLGIRTISPDSFVGLAGGVLVELALDSNAIESVPASTFRPLAAPLATISLSGNRLPGLDVGTFHAGLSTSLRWLYLSDNAITDDGLPATLFANLTSLVGLWLDGNRLTTIASGLLAPLTQLVWIDLSDNAIATIGPTTFAGLWSLERLSLQGNALADIGGGLLVPLAGSSTVLELFDISNNTISTMPTDDLRQLSTSGLVYLGLSG